MSRRSLRGFTLIELMVALGMALAVTTAAVSVMVLAVRTQHAGARRNDLSRDAQLAMDLMTRDLAYLGAGVPRGFEANRDGVLLNIGTVSADATAGQLNAEAPRALRPPIRIGRDDYLAFLGDAPYPNADINGIAAPGVFDGSGPAPRSHRVQITSELSPCGVPKSSSDYVCPTTEVSMVRDLGGGDCVDGSTNEPTCPWGMGKWQNHGAEVDLLFSAVDGSWYRRRWDMSNFADHNGRLLAHLAHTPDGNGADLPLVRFHESGVGGGMISTLDRIVYSLERQGSPGTACGGSAPCTLWRRQCWGWGYGDPAANNAGFPAVGASPGLSTNAGFPIACSAPNDGTPWEKVIDGIKSLRFRYYAADDLDTPLTTPLNAARSSAARVVEIELVVGSYYDPEGDGTFVEREEDDGAAPLEHRLVRRVWLENAGGIVNWPERPSQSAGGCYDTPDLPNECFPQ